MNKQLTQIAKDATNGSTVITNHTKVTTEDIIARFPGGISITAVDLINGEKGEYAVINFREDPGAWYGAGKILTNIVYSWLKALGGDLTTVNESLAAEPVRVKLGTKRLKNGNNLTTVDVLD